MKASLSPQDVAIDGRGDLYVADQSLGSTASSVRCQLRQITRSRRVIRAVAGSGTNVPYSNCLDLAVDLHGNVFFPDGDVVKEINRSTGKVRTVAGCPSCNGLGDGGRATRAPLVFASDVAVGSGGDLYIADAEDNRIRKVDRNGFISTIAGNGRQGFSGDGGPATSARLNGPSGVAIGPHGSVYIADTDNNRIRLVTGRGVIRTIAGSGQPCPRGDPRGCFRTGYGGKATKAVIYSPSEIGVDNSGNLFLPGDVVREVPFAHNAIWTIAGSGKNESRPETMKEHKQQLSRLKAAQAEFSGSSGIVVAPNGNLYIADTYNGLIRLIVFKQVSRER